MSGINSSFVPAGAVKPSSIENDVYQADVAGYRFTEVPTSLQMRADYDGQTDGQPAYVGFCARGFASSAGTWLVQKFTYDGSRQMTVRQSGFGTWDNRTSLTYA